MSSDWKVYEEHSCRNTFKLFSGNCSNIQGIKRRRGWTLQKGVINALLNKDFCPLIFLYICIYNLKLVLVCYIMLICRLFELSQLLSTLYDSFLAQKIGCFCGMGLGSQTGSEFYLKVISSHNYSAAFFVCMHVQLEWTSYIVWCCNIWVWDWWTIVRFAHSSTWGTCNWIHVWEGGVLCWYVLQKCKLLLCYSYCYRWGAPFMWGCFLSYSKCYCIMDRSAHQDWNSHHQFHQLMLHVSHY